MSAALTDKFKKVGVAGTLTNMTAPGKALAASSFNVGSGANYPTDTAFIVAVRVVDTDGEEVDNTYTEWIAIISGTAITINPTPVYGSDQVYAAGSTTQVFIPLSAKRDNDLIDGLLVSLKQDGTPQDSLSFTTPTILSPTLKGLIDGWVSANESWAYASASTITVPTDATTKYDIGDIIKMTQSSTVKIFVVTAVAATLLTVSGLSGVTVANSAITSNSYSKARTPHAAGAVGAVVYNPYKFGAYLAGAQNTGNPIDTYSRILFETESFDTNNNFDSTSTKGTYTAPVAGFYLLSATVGITIPASETYEVAFFVNGTIDKRFTRTIAQTVEISASGSYLRQLAAGDTVDVRASCASARALVVGAAYTNFSGHLVSQK